MPHAQYVKLVRQQAPEEGWLTEAGIRQALGHMVVTDEVVSQLGPALTSGNSLLLYGKPGDGKTFLIESLNRIASAPIFVPHAIECQGHIIRVFDPVYHERLDERITAIRCDHRLDLQVEAAFKVIVREANAIDGVASATRYSVARRVSSSPAKRW